MGSPGGMSSRNTVYLGIAGFGSALLLSGDMKYPLAWVGWASSSAILGFVAVLECHGSTMLMMPPVLMYAAHDARRSEQQHDR